MKDTLKFNAPFILIIFIYLYLTNLSLDVSQWREDQATQLWLGYTFKLSDLPIGLISSQEIPNPNGNIVLAKFIGFFPKFINSLFVYILFQAFLLLFFVKSLKIKKVYLSYIVFCILVFNTYFLFSATELWSQYLMVSLNFLVLGYIFFKIDHSHSINVLNAINLVLLLPSVYLGGFLNAFSLLIIFSYLVIFHKLKIYLKLNIFNVSVFLFLITYIWFPYFQNIEFSSLFLSSRNSESSLDLSNIIKNLIFNNIDEPYIIQSDHQIFPQSLLMTRTLIITLNFSFNIVFLFCLCVLFINYIFKKPTKKISYKSKVLFLFYYSNILISPVIGGPNF